MKLAEGSYCVVDVLNSQFVRKNYKLIGSFNTFIEHYIHTQTPAYPHLLKSLHADGAGYILPRYPYTAYQMVVYNKLPFYTREQLFVLGLQLIYTVEYLHRLGFVHGDISLGNLMIRDETLVLSDFNLSEFMGWPNRTITNYRSYINYYRHYRNTTHGLMSATTDWYATAITLSELWGRALVIQNPCYRRYRDRLGLLPVNYVEKAPTRSVGVGDDLDNDAKEAITAAMFFSDDYLRNDYLTELRLDQRERQVVELLLNHDDSIDVLSRLTDYERYFPAPLPDLADEYRSLLYQPAPTNATERLTFYRDVIEHSSIPELNLDGLVGRMADICVDRWYSDDKTTYLGLYPIRSLMDTDALITLRQVTDNNIYGRLRALG